MKGISTVNFHGKKVYMIDFADAGGSKEETIARIVAIEEELMKNPLNSVLALVNVADAFFHFDTLKTFKQFNEKTGPYIKRVAVTGLIGLKKVGFNSVTNSSNRKGSTKAFDSQQQAKDWLLGE
jgi:hypothetical protein